jgi:hypothetical protein
MVSVYSIIVAEVSSSNSHLNDIDASRLLFARQVSTIDIDIVLAPVVDNMSN